MSAPNPHRSYWSAAPLLIVLFCLKTSFAELQEWTPTGGPHGGPIRRLFQDPGRPNTVYAIGARGGIWKSSSKGRDWTSLSRRDEDTNASDLQVDPRNGHVLFKTSNGRGVFRSDDGGLNWQDITPATDYRTFTHILLHPKHPDVVHAVRGGRGKIPHGIWTSLDGGLSWTPPGRLLPVQSIAVDPNDPDILFVGTAHGSFFRTRNRGENWDEIAFPQDLSIDTLVVDFTTSTRILAGTSAGVYVTLDGGDTWSSAGMEDQSIRVVRLASGDPLQVFVATDSGVFSSRDGGQTWTSLGLDRSVVDLVVDSEDVEYILAVTERGVFRREKEQVPWMSSNEGLDSTPVESFAFDRNNPDTIYAGSRGFIAKTEDKGKTWVNSYLSQEDGTFVTDVTVVTPDPHHPLRLYVGTPQGAFRSRNGGIDWEQVNAGLTHLQVQDLKVDPVQPDLVYVAMGESSSNGWTNTSTGGVFRSEDGGKSWVPSGFDDQYSNCLSFAPSGDVYVVNAGLWRSQDQGRSWARLDVSPEGLPLGGFSCSGLIIHPERPEVLYLGGHNGFFKSLDGGTRWESSSTGLRFLHRGWPFILSLALHPEDSQTIYAGLGTGVYETRNGGWRWFPISEGIPVSRVECVGVHPRETDLIYSCPSQGGLWEYRTPPPISLNLRYSTFGPLLSDQPDEFTGTALLNLDDVDTSVQLTAYGGNGVPLVGTDITNPVTLDIPPRGQRALLAREIWGPGLSAMEGAGWIRVDASSPRLSGLWAIGNRNMSSLDGAGFDPLGTNEFIFPELTTDGSTLLQIVNPNMQTVRGGLSLRTPGRMSPYRLLEIPPQGMLSGSLADLFGDITVEDSAYVWGATNNHVLPLLVIRPEDGDAALVPHLPRKDGPKILYAPQFAVGPGITTEISLVNHGPDCNTAAIQVRLFENSGTQIGRHRELFIPCGGKLRLTGEELVATTQELFSAYVEVWSTLPLQGTVLFRGKNGSTFLAALPLVGNLEKEQVFAHLASGPSFFMGLTILNPGEESPSLLLEAFGMDAALLAERTFDLSPGERMSQLLSEYFPKLAGQEIAGGYVRLHSDKGVLAFALFAPWNLSALMTVPSQTLPAQTSRSAP